MQIGCNFSSYKTSYEPGVTKRPSTSLLWKTRGIHTIPVVFKTKDKKTKREEELFSWSSKTTTEKCGYMSVINHIQTGRRYQRCDGQKPQIINKIRQLKQQQANAKQLKLVSAFRWVTEATTYPCWLTHDQGDQMSLFMWDCTRFLCLCPPAPIYQDSVPHFTGSAGCALFWLLPGACKGSNTVGLMGKSPKSHRFAVFNK